MFLKHSAENCDAVCLNPCLLLLACMASQGFASSLDSQQAEQREQSTCIASDVPSSGPQRPQSACEFCVARQRSSEAMTAGWGVTPFMTMPIVAKPSRIIIIRNMRQLLHSRSLLNGSGCHSRPDKQTCQCHGLIALLILSAGVTKRCKTIMGMLLGCRFPCMLQQQLSQGARCCNSQPAFEPLPCIRIPLANLSRFHLYLPRVIIHQASRITN